MRPSRRWVYMCPPGSTLRASPPPCSPFLNPLCRVNCDDTLNINNLVKIHALIDCSTNNTHIPHQSAPSYFADPSRRPFLRLHTSADTSSATSRNETDLLSGASATAASRRLTNVLVVTSSVGMIHRVHAHTAHLRPLIALHSELVVRTTRLQHRLVHAASAGHDSHHATAATRYNQHKERKAYLEETVFLMPEGRRMNVMLRSSE